MASKKKINKGELVLGGVSGVCAGLFTTPLEVVKIRMQLQGELKAKGDYSVHYRNVFHATYTIGKRDGVLAFYKGIVPALTFQFVMNGTRLGFYQWGDSMGFTRKKDGKVSTLGSILIASLAGTFSCMASSPLLLIKTHLQSQANEKAIAVGHQHTHKGMFDAFQSIYSKFGVRGLWRGTIASFPRFIVGSAIQLPTFALASQYIRSKQIFKEGSWFTPLFASMFSAAFVSLGMAPFDTLSTRFYNQGVNSSGKGLFYNSIADCAVKIYRKEGILGFYKGLLANYFRVGPQTLLCLVFWDQLKFYNGKYFNK